MAKSKLSPHFTGRYKLRKGLTPGKYDLPGYGIIDFRTATLKELQLLRKQTGDRWILAIPKKPAT